MSIEYEQSNINGIMAVYHECGQESAADDVISCHFLLTSNLVTSNHSTALNCQTNKQRAEQTKRIYKKTDLQRTVCKDCLLQCAELWYF